MRGDLTSPRHGERQIDGFRGLLSNAPDIRAIPAGYLRTAHNVVYDERGYLRPRDGSEAYWSAISQRIYFTEMELSENGTWTNGAANSSVVKFGYQSRVINGAGATAMDRVLPASIDLTLGGVYTASQMSINYWARAATPADMSAATLEIASDAGFANSYTWNILSQLTALAANTWTELTKTLASGTVAGTPNLTAMRYIRLTITQTAGTNLYFDDIYVNYSNYARSYCLGQYPFRKISSAQRYHLAMFGETLFADANEALAPYKVKSQFTRNLPTYYETAEDRAFIFNGTDTPLMFTGTMYRNIGYPKPTTNATLTPGGAGTGSMVDGVYYYGYTFVYGEGAVVHGESSMYEMSAGATVNSGGANTGSVAITALPVGALGAGVIKRRIYRSRVGAGANATKYFVAEVADNTTTTYTDQFADASIIINAEGPINNGIPPTAKYAKWFQKGMVYFTNTAIYWSRPGTNLNETPETVPAENIITLGNAGEISGAMEFNGRLYVFQKRGIGKLQWRGSSLEYLPVQRTGDSNAQGIGCHDQNGLTVVADRYLLWKDTEGQDWKMLPNEEIFPESRDVANLCDDFNRLPVVGTFDYYVTDSEAQWNLGTVGSNLSTSLQSGRIQYKDRTALSSSGPTSATWKGLWNTTAYGVPTVGPYYNTGSATDIRFGSGLITSLYQKITAQKALKFSKVKLYGHPGTPFVAGVGAVALYKCKYQNAALATSLQLGDILSTAAGFTFTSVQAIEIELDDVVYIPKGESVILRVDWDGVGRFALGAADSATYSNGDFQITGIETTGGSLPNGRYPYIGLETANSNPTAQTTASFDGGTTLQRWHALKYGSVAMKAGAYISVAFEVSPDNVSWFFLSQVYRLSALPGAAYANAPVTSEDISFWYIPDYRVGQPGTASQQWRYGRFQILIDQTFSVAPTDEVYSAVSIVETDTFPSLVDPEMTRSTEASFATYDKANYARDIYLSETVDGVSIGSLGKFYADFMENQQTVYFQFQTSATTTFAATWYDVTPGELLPATAIVASARYFRYRVIFQDDPNKNDGTPSWVEQVKINWAQGSAVIGPFMPSTLYYYKDQIYISWPTRGSRIHDRSMCLDAFKRTYEDTPHLYSTFGSPHYVNYATVNGVLVGAPSTGGTLSKLRNSQVADVSVSVLGPECVVETHPLTMGTYNIKTLYWLYIGFQLAIFRKGFFVDEPGVYPTVTGPVPYFNLSVGAIKQALSAVNGSISMLAIGAYGAQAFSQQFKQILSHSGDVSTIGNYDMFKPYTPEYGFNCALQERSFAVRVNFRAVKDTAGESWFPLLTGIGAEYHVENIRGV